MNRFRADLILLTVALIWGSAFAVQRVAAHSLETFTFNALRFLLGGFILFPFSKFALWTKKPRQVDGNGSKRIIIDKKSLFYVLGAGFVLFAGSALQQAGLKYTTAGNAAFITTLYVVLVPIILVIFFREKIHWIAWVGAVIAIAGSLLLSTGGSLQLAPGDNLEMAAAVMWALDVILVSQAVQHMDILTFSCGHYLVAGLLNIMVSIWMPARFIGLETAWWTIVYIGVLSTALGYTLQALGQKYAPPTDAAILLSMEAVFAALAGFFFLDETMLPVQLIGCSMILIAVMITQINAAKSKTPIPQEDK